ncbi:MAG: ATPase domain-containing protein [Candidatus Altiarchaeota archaeon]
MVRGCLGVGVILVRTITVDFGGESKEFPLGVSVLVYGLVASGKTTFSLTLAREFLKNNLPCIWICVDEGPASVREKMAYFNINYQLSQEKNMLRFIDVYSEQITGKPMQDKYVINSSSAFNLNEINRGLMRALSEVTGQGIVVFDSVSTLLLYNRSATCEEFLKVHMSRITTAGFTGFFIMQRDLHDQQTEETLKMMCDSVLEFGFEKDMRKISIIKLPLGSSGEWIESSLFSWQQPRGVTISHPSGPRKYMDSGGYIEGIKEGLVEGLRDGLSELSSDLRDSSSVGVSGVGVSASRGASSGLTSESQGGSPPPSGGVSTSGAPTSIIQNINKQINVTELSELPKKLGEEISQLVNQQIMLRGVLNEKEEQTRQSRKRLDILMNKEVHTMEEVREIEERRRPLLAAIDSKNTLLSELEAEMKAAETRYREALKRKETLKAKVDAVLIRKKSLESKIHDIVEYPGDVHIAVPSYMQESLNKVNDEVVKSKEAVGALEVRINTIANESGLLKDELTEVTKHGGYKMDELQSIRGKKAKVESELSLVSKAREETESRLNTILQNKKMMEEKLKELMEGSK